MVEECACPRGFRFKAIGPRERALDASDDLSLLLNGRKGYMESPNFGKIDGRVC